MLVIGVFGREVRFKPINKVDAGTGATIVWPANFLETWARAQSRDNQTSASSKVGKRFVIGVSRIFSNVARIDESPVSIDSIYPSDAYFTLALNFLSPRPIGDNEISSVTRMGSSPREINCHPFPYFPLSSLKSREYGLQFVISRCDTFFYVNPRKAFSAEKSNAIFIMSRAARGENECIRQFAQIL